METDSTHYVEQMDEHNMVQSVEDNVNACRKVLRKKTLWDMVPLLNGVKNLRKFEFRLVRCRFMIQNILNPVYYVDRCDIFDSRTNSTEKRSGKYRDHFDICEDYERMMSDPILKECPSVYCVDIPALNDWAKLRHPYSNNEDPVIMLNEAAQQGIAMEDDLRTFNCFCAEYCRSGISCEESGISQDSILNSGEFFVNLYDVDPELVKLNDVIEVIGFLYFPLRNSDDENEMHAEVVGTPRIHAIHCSPYMVKFQEFTTSIKQTLMENADSLRDKLWLLLTQVLAGDTLAADYMICHLISSVLKRIDVTINGKFSLNLYRFPHTACSSQYVIKFYGIISQLVEKSRYFLLTTESLNTAVMVPKKNYEKGTLVSGLLQLTSGTHLILDETQLSPGELTERGARNANALRSLVRNQQLDYDFEYYTIPFETDVPVLSISDDKSILSSDYYLPMDVDPSCLNELETMFETVNTELGNTQILNTLREYLKIIRGSVHEYTIPQEIATMVTDYYKGMRQEGKMNAEDLCTCLEVARLMSVSKGRMSLQKSDWDYACLMEQQRKGRIEVKSIG